MSNHTGSLFSSFQLPSSSTREYRRQQQQSTNNTNSINSHPNKNQSTNNDVTTRTSSTTGNGNNGTNSSSNTAPPSRPLLESEDRAANLTHAQISQYFNLPLHEAIVQLRVDEGSLKRRCRQLGISRWPYRKRVNLLKSKNNNNAADIRNVAITPINGIRSQFHQYNLHTMSSPSPSPMDTSNQMTDDDEHEQPSSQQSSSHVHHQSTTMNSSPSSKLKEVKKKAADSLFKCFQVFKAPNKEPSPQKMTQEEHQRKQSTMQGEFNSKLEPVAEPPRTSQQQQPQQHQHLPQPSYHHNSDNNNYQYPQQPHSDDFNSNHEGYSARWQQPMNNNQDAYWKKGGNGDHHQQQPQQQQQQQLTGSPPSIMSKLHQYHTQASNNHVRPYHQERPTPSTPHQFNHNHFNSNYHQYPQSQQQGSYSSPSSSRVAPSPHLQPLPSISDMLASIHEDENMMNKKRSRRDSADQVYQQQFAGPT